MTNVPMTNPTAKRRASSDRRHRTTKMFTAAGLHVSSFLLRHSLDIRHSTFMIANLIAAFVWLTCWAPLATAADRVADQARPLRVCLVSGSVEYKSDESLAAFQQYLEAKYPARCTRAFWVADRPNDLP